MRNILVDNENEIRYEGTDAKEILRILNADVYSVSEDDELIYMEKVRLLLNDKGECKFGDLRHQVHIDIKFKGIDSWNRPVFKDIEGVLHFGCTNILAPSIEIPSTSPEYISDYFKDRIYALEYFGSSFDCEPHGGLPSNYKLKIITENK